MPSGSLKATALHFTSECKVQGKALGYDVGIPDHEYRYLVKPRALETFVNLMKHEGIIITDPSATLSFPSPRILDMKSLKERGVLWSYTIIRITKNEELIEIG
jgi:hypothetical protein